MQPLPRLRKQSSRPTPRTGRPGQPQDSNSPPGPTATTPPISYADSCSIAAIPPSSKQPARPLLRRNDIHGTRLVAEAITKAHDLARLGLGHIDHLHDAVINHVFSDAPVDDLMAHCNTLTQDPDPTTATGATHLANWIRLLTTTAAESRYPAQQQDRS